VLKNAHELKKKVPFSAASAFLQQQVFNRKNALQMKH
jgi:hypothetical protein